MASHSSGNLIATAVVAGAIGGALAYLLLGQQKKAASSIKRYRNPPGTRSCAALVHNGVVYLSGQVGIIDELATSDITAQTRQTLEKIDTLLAEAGTDKTQILSSQIWLKSISADFVAFNKVWNAWVDPESKGVRACVQSEMARPLLLVEVQVIAALK